LIASFGPSNTRSHAQIVQSALPPTLSLLALVAGLHRLDTVLIVYACSYGACGCLGGAFILRDWRGVLVDRPHGAATPPEPLPPLWTTARPLFVVELVQVSLLSLPVLALGAFADPMAVSAFSIVSRMTMMINTILVSIATIARPAFARYHRRHEFARLRLAARQAPFLALAVCLPIIAIILIFPHTLLSQLGRDFASHAAVTAMILLCAGQLVNVFPPTEDMMLSMTGRGRTLRALNLQ
jgi:O-antigen/teichoic acid export membrane protein